MGISVKRSPLSPASSNRTFQWGTSESRFAMTEPAEPEPTMTKSYSSKTKF